MDKEKIEQNVIDTLDEDIDVVDMPIGPCYIYGDTDELEEGVTNG